MNSLTLTNNQLDLLAVAWVDPAAHKAAARLIVAASEELAMRDRRGREDGPLYRITEAIMAGCDAPAVAGYLDSEAAAVEARHAAARDRLGELSLQLAARRGHRRRHDEHVAALACALSGEFALLVTAATRMQNDRTREIAALVAGGFTTQEAHATMDGAETRALQRKREALAAAGIAPEDAPLVPTESQFAEEKRQRAARLKADLERVHAFQRDELRDVAGLPGWVQEAIEAGAIALHDDATNRRLLPA
ncbi:hypothetical protein [Sphaerotilus sp.]|uniref:hypothetical protein n=1 Tax=Sphaerotilus sp. TaxID=2093942 RepID=UPI00286D95C8|nr:hypothetical protein [Sphaerotilus sp.]